MAGEDKAEGPVGGFLDADAGGDEGCGDGEGVFADLQRGAGAGDVKAVVGGARDAESLAEAAGAGGELAEKRACGMGMRGQAAVDGHLIEAGERLEGADKDAAGLAFGFAGDVEAEVFSVDGVDVGVAGAAEEDGVARGDAAVGVGSGVGWSVVGAEVSFDLDDAAGEGGAADAVDQQLAEETRGDELRRVLEEGAG